MTPSDEQSPNVRVSSPSSSGGGKRPAFFEAEEGITNERREVLTDPRWKKEEEIKLN